MADAWDTGHPRGNAGLWVLSLTLNPLAINSANIPYNAVKKPKIITALRIYICIVCKLKNESRKQHELFGVSRVWSGWLSADKLQGLVVEMQHATEENFMSYV